MKKIIDAKGKNCPMPVIMAKKEIDAGVKFFEIEVAKALQLRLKKTMVTLKLIFQMVVKSVKKY